jgi:transcriptional regulator with XRE-family HTH domain
MDRQTLFSQRFGQRLRALREEKGWRPAEVAARLGCSTDHYRKLEFGTKGIARPMLCDLARVFRVDEVDFFIFPDADPVRHGLYEMLRQFSPSEILRAKAAILDDQMRRSVIEAQRRAEESELAAARERKRQSK